MPEAPLASLDLLRQITDHHVVGQLLGADALTRAEIAQRTGISKPTISEAMRRLQQAGLVVETGQQSGRRGRAGTFYALRPDIGCAVALSASPDGLTAEIRGVRGELVRRFTHDVAAPITADRLSPLLDQLADEVLAAAVGPIRGSALSLAGPVDKRTGRLVHLPDSPFLVDELDPRTLLGARLPGLHIDNDVNWAALAEAQAGRAQDLDEFVYCHLGFGLGGAIVRERVVFSGSAGLAGEIAHVRTSGPEGRSMRLVECFETWGLTQPGTPTIDVPRVIAALDEPPRREAIVDAVAGAIASIVTVLNPAGVMIGGPWSSATGLIDRLATRVGELSAVPVDVRLAELGMDAPLTGAALHAVAGAQASLTT